MRPPGSARDSRVVISPAPDRPLDPALVGSGLVLRQRLELLHRPQVPLVELDRGPRGRLASPAALHGTPDVRRPALGRKGGAVSGGKGRDHVWAAAGKSCYKSRESHEEVPDGRAERWTAAGPLPRERGCPVRLRSSVARDPPAAGRPRGARNPPRPFPARVRRGAHGGPTRQHYRPGGCRALPPW